MAIVTAFIRVSTTKKKEVNVRFRLMDGRAIQLLYSSELKVRPEHWNPKREEIKAKVLIDPVDRAEFNRNVNNLKALIMDLYNAAPDKSVLTSDWLKSEMQKKLHPVVQAQNTSKSFFDDFDYFLSIRKLSDVRTRNFRVLYRALQRFEYYRRLNVYKKYTLKYDSVTPDILHEFEVFLRQEHTFFKIDEETGKSVCLRQHKPIYDAFPETRTPKQRGQNTINDLFTKLRTFSAGQWKAVKHRIIRSLISQFRNVFMVRHTTLRLKRGISYIIPILIITQPWLYSVIFSCFSV